LLVAIGVIRVHASRLVLEPSGLRILVVQVTGCHGLLLLSIDRVTEPVHRTLLLISLVVASGLDLGRGGVVKERVRIALLQLPPPQLLLFLAELDRLCQVCVLSLVRRFLSPSSALLFSFSLAGFNG